MNVLDIVAGPVLRIIDKLVPDAQAKAQMQLEAMKLAQSGEFKEIDAQLQRDLAQVEVNKIEAQSSDLFRGGWRPAVGWVCVIGLLYTYLAQPLLTWASGMWSMGIIYLTHPLRFRHISCHASFQRSPLPRR